MAGPVAHIFCALSVLNSGAIHVTDQKAFLVGTSFPNIRYLKKIKNELKHKKMVTWDTVKNEPSSFKAGMYFHILVAEARDRYFIKHGIHEKLPKKKNLEHALKIYEDMIIYDWVDDWQSIVGYFDTIMPQEERFQFDQARITLWHTCLQQYLIVHPTREYVSDLIIKLHPTFSTMASFLKPFSVRILKYYMNTLLDTLEKTPEVKEIITSFYQNYIEHLTQ